MTDLVTPYLHLQIKVVEQAPATETFDRPFPFHTVGGIEQTGLTEGMHKGTVRQIVEDTILRQTRKLGTFLLQLLGQFLRLGTVYLTRSSLQVVDIRFQGIVVSLVVFAELFILPND